MKMPQTLRRFPMTIASLALLAIPLGCNSESPAPPVAEAPPQAPVVTDFAPTPGSPPTPGDTMPPAVVDGAAQGIDKDVRRTAADAKDLGEEARLAAEQAEDRIKGGVKKAEDDARKKIKDAKGHVKRTVEDVEADAKRRAKAVEDDARKSAEGALDNLLGAPK